MSRELAIKVHLVLAGLFLPFLIIIPLSGGLYLIGEKGTYHEHQEFLIEEKLPETKKDFERRVREIFKEQGISYEFEYAKMRSNGADLRPTSKDHYIIRNFDGVNTSFFFKQPNVWASLIELHKGHGPKLFKWLQIVFAVGLLCIGISGVYMALSLSTQRKPLFISAVVGFAIFLAALLI